MRQHARTLIASWGGGGVETLQLFYRPPAGAKKTCMVETPGGGEAAPLDALRLRTTSEHVQMGQKLRARFGLQTACNILR